MSRDTTITSIREALERESDLAPFALTPVLPASTLPLALLSIATLGEDQARRQVELPIALELMHAAVVTHYHSGSSVLQERLIAGDHWYARAMVILSRLGRPDLIGALAEATEKVAAGHAETELTAEVLHLRASLFVAAVELPSMLLGVAPAPPAIGYAAQLGLAREQILVGIPPDIARLSALRDSWPAAPAAAELLQPLQYES